MSERVAALGAWALSTTPPTTSQFGTVSWGGGTSFTAGPNAWYALTGPLSGADNCAIENIWITDNGVEASGYLGDTDTENENLTDHWLGNVTDNYCLDGASDPVITDNNYEDNATIPYEVPFDIVVPASIVADADMVGDKASHRLVAYVNPDNVYMTLDWWGSLVNPSASDSQGDVDENTQDTGYEYAFDNDRPWNSGENNNGYEGSVGDGYNGDPTDLANDTGKVDYARVNFVFTRGDHGFTLPAGGSINISVTLYVWA